MPDTDTPKKRGRQPSPLAQAGRDYDDAKRRVAKLELRYANLSEKLADVTAQLDDANKVKEEAYNILSATLSDA